MPKTDNGYISRDDPPHIIARCLNCDKPECNNCVLTELRKGGLRKQIGEI